MNAMLIVTRDYEEIARFRARKNKANQNQLPAFGRKSEALSSKSYNKTNECGKVYYFLEFMA
jgi:hypothetical protein